MTRADATKSMSTARILTYSMDLAKVVTVVSSSSRAIAQDKLHPMGVSNIIKMEHAFSARRENI